MNYDDIQKVLDNLKKKYYDMYPNHPDMVYASLYGYLGQAVSDLLVGGVKEEMTREVFKRMVTELETAND